MMPETESHPTPLRSTGARAGKQVYLSLGSNRGDRVANLRRAMEELGKSGVKVQRVSSFYKTEPVDFGPQAWFLNCAVEARNGIDADATSEGREIRGADSGPAARRQQRPTTD